MTKLFTKLILIPACACLLLPAITNAQVYQLPNSGFDRWENGIKLDGSEFTTTMEPVGWNSFGTGTGNAISLANMFVKNYPLQKNRGTEEEPDYYASIYSGGVFGIVANGNMTTGIIRAQEADAASEENYNFTPLSYDISDYPGVDNFRQKFDGKPDALKALIQYIPKQERETDVALVTAWIHKDGDNFQNPYEQNVEEKAVAYAFIEPDATEAKDWKEFVVPFDYSVGNEDNEPAYILFSVTTNRLPGQGSIGDTINIDDIEMIYYHTLTDIKIKGISIGDFDENTFDYELRGEIPLLEDITYVSKGRGAIVTIMREESNREGEAFFSISVEANDYEESGNVSIYSLMVTEYNSELAAIKLDGVDLPDFDPESINYTIELNDLVIPVITAEAFNDYAVIDISAPDQDNRVTITVTDGDLYTVYTLSFVKKDSGIYDSKAEGADIYSANGQIIINNYNGVADIYNVSGQKIKSLFISNTSKFGVETPGVYIVRTTEKAVVLVVE